MKGAPGSGTGQAGSSGVRPEAKPQPQMAKEVDVPERDVLVGAKLEELVDKEGPEAEQEVAKLLAANEQDPNRNGAKPDPQNELVDVVTNENPPSAPAFEPPSDPPAPPVSKGKGKQTEKKRRMGA